jgi:2-amino-4-hydroxy-6-hydroxymethyldihydropteridine diphosphokinase
MEQEDVIAYLGLGSNLGDREKTLSMALEAIERFPTARVLRVSPLYSSEPWGPVEQCDFLNIVAEISTSLAPQDLLKLCKDTEKALGRVDSVRWGPRAVDIDILLYDDLTLKTDTLQIPHASMWDRAFVLKPLADLRPDLRDPGGRPIIDVLESPEIARQGVWLHDERASEPGNGK